MAISGVQMIRDYPITGVGLGMVTRLYPALPPRRRAAVAGAPPPQQPAADRRGAGPAGARGLPVAARGVLCDDLAQRCPGCGRVRRAAVASSLVAILGITVAGLFEYNFWSAPVQYLTLVVMGAGVGMVERGPE